MDIDEMRRRYREKNGQQEDNVPATPTPTVQTSATQAPQVSNYSGEIIDTWVEHNVENDGVLGLKIHVAFSVNGLKNVECAIGVFFRYENGDYLKYNDNIIAVKDYFTPPYDECSNDDFFLFIPYDELYVGEKIDLKYDVELFHFNDDKVFCSSDLYPLPYIKPKTEMCKEHNEPGTNPVKHGRPSIVTISDGRFDYEKGTNKVSFSCARIQNDSEEDTGTLWLDCWISDKEMTDDDEWQTENHSLIDSIQLGWLKKGYGFPDVDKEFVISQNDIDFLAKLSDNDSECHFIFTVYEENADNDGCIIRSYSGYNINEIWLSVDDEDIELHFYRSEHKIKAYLNGEPFTGTLVSTDDRVTWKYKDSILDSIFVYHDNNKIAIMWWRDNYSFFDYNDNEMNKDEFDKMYKNIRDIYVNARIEREKLSIDMD